MRVGMRTLALGAALVLSAGCGLTPTVPVASPLTSATVRAADESDHAQMNALVRSVLVEQWPVLMEQADANHDGAIARSEYLAGRDEERTALFLAQFDPDQDATVTGAEYQAALQPVAAVEAYHHFTEERMGRAITGYMADKEFSFTDLRAYLTHDLGLRGDFQLVGAIFSELDLNEDGKLLSAKGEGPAFMLKFARPQLQHDLALPVFPVR